MNRHIHSAGVGDQIVNGSDRSTWNVVEITDHEVTIENTETHERRTFHKPVFFTHINALLGNGASRYIPSQS